MTDFTNFTNDKSASNKDLDDQNKQEIANFIEKNNIDSFDADMITYCYENRNKNRMFVINVASVARSGMSRQLKVGIIKDGEFFDITFLVAQVTKRKLNRDKGTIKIDGCGMDMRFALLMDFYESLGTMQPNYFNAVQNFHTF